MGWSGTRQDLAHERIPRVLCLFRTKCGRHFHGFMRGIHLELKRLSDTGRPADCGRGPSG